ncbi:MAG TPA: hypothetical protein VFS90_23020 [Pyrinomonadaceae bacterium]|nr:hypothetical protein [Pyrinomonadaceae bacterium]
MSFAKEDIVINDVTGGGNGGKLKNTCHFLPSGDGKTYNFFAGGKQKASGLENNSKFTFNFDGQSWTLKIKSISDAAASGDWKDNGTVTGEISGGISDVPDQTFQAQAGSGAKPRKDVAAAKA